MRVHTRLLVRLRGRWAKYCEQRVCVYVCLFHIYIQEENVAKVVGATLIEG